MGGLQVADTVFGVNRPCDREICENTEKKRFHMPPCYPLGSSCSLLKQTVGGSMDKKVVLITGCSSGIGLSLAVRLASDPDKTFKGNRYCLLLQFSC